MPKQKPRTERKVLVVSDIHCGSIFGMLSDKFETSDGVVKLQNLGQKYLWQCWNHLCDYVKEIEPDVIVVNGDVVDGTQRAQQGTELSLPLMFDQRGAAIETLRPLSVIAPMYFVKGTEYHDCKAGASVEAVAEDLHARRYAGVGQGKFSKDILDLDVDGVILNFSHGIGVAGGLYRTTAIDRESVWSELAAALGKAPKADCIVRSHAHYFVHIEHPNKHALITPCWQLQTTYMRKNSAYRMMPDIGAVVIHISPEEKEEGRDPIWVEKILYPLPDHKPTKLQLP